MPEHVVFSHANGYKVDIRRNPMLDAYIEGFKKIQNRSDGPNGGYEQWKSPDGDIYCVCLANCLS
jgi:hypothetical protein